MFGDVVDGFSDITESLNDLMSDIASGDLAGILGSTVDLAGEVMETAAPLVSMYNPVAGAALRVGGSVLDAVEDGKITAAEVYNIGESVLKSVGLESAIGSSLQGVAGINAIAEQHVVNILEKMINGEPVTQQDVDFLGDLINLLNLQGTERASGKGKGKSAGGAGAAEGAGGAGGAEGAAGGSSIFELFATILGKKMGESLQKMQDVAKKIEGIDLDSEEAGTELGQLVPQFNAAAQEFSFVSQNFNTAINALGEGLKAAARKQ